MLIGPSFKYRPSGPVRGREGLGFRYPAVLHRLRWQLFVVRLTRAKSHWAIKRVNSDWHRRDAAR